MKSVKDRLLSVNKKSIVEFLTQNMENSKIESFLDKVNNPPKLISSEKNTNKVFERIKIAFRFGYFGEFFHGEFYQTDTENTVEEHIFKALLKAQLIPNIDDCDFSRCGRTDIDVSSVGNVFSCFVKKGDNYNYMRILNRLLPKEIRILGCQPVPDDFSSRFNCLSRGYRYFFTKGQLDIDKMQVGASKLVGTHNYTNFCKLVKNKPNKNYVFSSKKTHNKRN